MGRSTFASVAIAIAALLGIALLGPGGTGEAAPPSGQPIPGRYIIVLQPGADAQTVARDYGLRPDIAYQHALNGFAGTVHPQQAAALRADMRVASVEPDRFVSLVAQTLPTSIERVFADDNGQLDIDGIDDYRVDADVAIIDTGIDLDHPDLNVVASMDCRYESGGPPWQRTVSCGSGGNDDNGHGTHTAGSAAALDNGLGVVGVAPGARLWAVKVLDQNGSGKLSWVIAGIDYVTANAGQIDVANMSLGCECSSPAMNEAIANSVAAGVTYAVAAGNSDKDASTFSPANHQDVITVSALADFDGAPGGLGGPTCRSDEDDTLANFSNYGSLIEIAAPGACIRSTYLGGGYATYSGTSMAAPHVAGAAALLASNGMAPATIRSTLIANGNYNWTDDSGDGIQEPLLDLSNSTVFAPAMVSGTETGDVKPTVSITSPADGAKVSGSVPVSTDASDDNGVTQVAFYYDGGSGPHLIATDGDGSNGWSVSWDSIGVGDGAYTLTAVATDTASQTSSASVAVTVDNVDDPPAVAVTNPANGLTVGGSVTVSANASDDNGVTQVEFFVDGVSIGVDGSNSGGWSVSWDTTTATDGVHTVSATATDTAAQTSSHSVSVTVDNSAPAVATTVTADSIIYWTTGGRNSDQHLRITVSLLDNLGDPVSGASVSIELYRDGALDWSGTNTSGTNGTVAFSMNNAPAGTYTTTIMTVTARGLTWDAVTPTNGFTK